MNLFRKLIIYIMSFIFIITLTGCVNRKELNSIGIVETVGLDLTKENKAKITFELVDASSLKRGGEKGMPVSQSYTQIIGDTTFDAFRNITLKYDRKLFIPHTKVYIFGEKAAKQGLINYMDWYQRDHETRRSLYIMIVKNGTAESVIGIKGGVEGSTAAYLESLIELSKANGKSTPVSLREFLRNYYSKGIEPIIGVLSIHKKIDIKDKDITHVGTTKELSVEGSAVCKSGKLVGYLNGNETRGFNFITNKIKSGLIAVKNKNSNKYSSIEILSAKSENSVKIKDDDVTLNISVKMNGMLGEELQSIDLTDPKVIKEIEDLCSKKIKKEIQESIHVSQNEYDSDIFGFGTIVHQKYPQKWKLMKDNWNEVFAKAKVNIKVETSIDRTGLVTFPASVEEAK